VEFRPLEASQRIPLLKAGSIDMECGGNTNTVKRQREVDFSYTFFNTGVRFLVKKPTTLDGPPSLLWNKRIAVTRGTTAEEVVHRLKMERGVQPVPVNVDSEGVRLVESGDVDGFAQDDVLLYGLQAGSRLKDELVISGNFMTVEPYAFMLPKGDIALREIVDKTMLGMMQNGEILALYRKWFHNERMRIPLNVYMRENLRFPSRYGIP
jgi:glutamate/aspartate transport system substrate-binding protein